jgi:hypothetical protein
MNIQNYQLFFWGEQQVYGVLTDTHALIIIYVKILHVCIYIWYIYICYIYVVYVYIYMIYIYRTIMFPTINRSKTYMFLVGKRHLRLSLVWPWNFQSNGLDGLFTWQKSGPWLTWCEDSLAFELMCKQGINVTGSGIRQSIWSFFSCGHQNCEIKQWIHQL